jgi:hypothetical protein
MSKKDPLDPQEVKTTRFEISADELEARMQKQNVMRVEPVKQAVALLEAALGQVLTKLGVNINLESEDIIKAQQEFLGITIAEFTEEAYPQLLGFFVYTGFDELIPYAWVGAARINSNGECFCDIQWFREEKLSETGGIKLV